MTEEKQRTLTQNDALHLGFQQIADQFRDRGLSVQIVLEMLKDGIELEWTKTLVKEILFKWIANKMFDKDSTAKLTTKELQEVWENMSRAIGKTEVYVPFPSVEGQMLRDLTDNN